jgi:hypothetical protein
MKIKRRKQKMKEKLFNKVKKLSEKRDVFAGFHSDKKDRQVLLWTHDNQVCADIGKDDYISNLYLEDKKGNLIVVWTYKNGWIIKEKY